MWWPQKCRYFGKGFWCRWYLERLLQSICGKWAYDHTESRKSICFGKRQWSPYFSERLLESICERLAEMVSIWAKSRWVSLLIVAKVVSFFALYLLTDDPKKVRVSVHLEKAFAVYLWAIGWNVVAMGKRLLRCLCGFCAWLTTSRKNRSTDLRLGGGGLLRVRKAVAGVVVCVGNRLSTAKVGGLYNLVLTQEEQKDYGSDKQNG